MSLWNQEGGGPKKFGNHWSKGLFQQSIHYIAAMSDSIQCVGCTLYERLPRSRTSGVVV
jgi:hypothetical protein